MKNIDCPTIQITKDSELYPSRLKQIMGDKAPDTLYCLGNTVLLKTVGVGFSGSRNVSEQGISVAKLCAGQFARINKTVISGYARGVDMSTHITALENGGNTIAVLAEGIRSFKIKKEILPFWDWSKVLVISQFSPSMPWTVYNAMERNTLIIVLSRAMIVIEAGEKGGTLNAGRTSLKYKVPLYVVDYADGHAQGNIELLKNGGRALKRLSDTASANINDILKDISSPISSQEQLSFF